MGKKKQNRRPTDPEPLLIVIPREDPLTRLLLRDEKEKALWDKKFGPPQPTEERGRERSETDSDRDDNKRQEIAPDSSNNSISSEEMDLEPAAVQGPSNMLTDRTTIQPSVALQHDSAAQITADRTTDNSSPLRSSTDSPQQLWKQLTTVRATIAQLQVYEASLVAQLPASQQVETASPPASAPTPPVHAMHVPMAAMLGAAVPLVQQPELHEPPQPSADTGHAASAPPPPEQPPRSARPPKQPRWTPCPPRGRPSYAAAAAAGAAAAAAAATAVFTSQTSWRRAPPHGRRHTVAAPSSFASTFHVRRNFVLKAPLGSLPDSAAPLKDQMRSFLGPRLPGASLPISDAVLLGSQATSTRVFFSLDSLEAADALVGRRGALKASGVSIQDFLTPEELKIKRALWPRFLEAKANGQRPQFHRARLVVS